MRKPRKRSIEIRNFILANIRNHPRDITLLATKQFDISRPAVLRHINKLIAEGAIIAHGTTRDRYYKLKLLVGESFTFNLSNNVEEDKVWRHLVRPLLREMPGNVMSICEYGINEMVNNVIDHSEGTKAEIHLEQSSAQVSFLVIDNGIGIFNTFLHKFLYNECIGPLVHNSFFKLSAFKVYFFNIFSFEYQFFLIFQTDGAFANAFVLKFRSDFHCLKIT